MRRVGHLAVLIGRRLRKGAALIILIAALVTLGQIGRREIPRLLRARYFQITDLVVQGNRRVPTASVIHSLDLPPHANMLDVDLRDLAGRIMRNPWVKTAGVGRRLPSSLFIRVSERTPRAVVLTDHAFLVSDDGTILKDASAEEMSDLPILRVKVDHPLSAGERLDVARLEQGARLWRKFQQDPLGPGVQAREIRLESDGSCTVSLGHGMPYLRFQEDAMRPQLDRLARVLRIRAISLRELEYADLRFADKVIIKPIPRGGEA
ncbi:MAG: FtsQ-type POTRA domain-containing protein [Candidatus Methylomirabilis oxyfera]|nr:FtsQ-type POTRA domain-containing protein [Candidatus Methylomirabilis oxyfera]